MNSDITITISLSVSGAEIAQQPSVRVEGNVPPPPSLEEPGMPAIEGNIPHPPSAEEAGAVIEGNIPPPPLLPGAEEATAAEEDIQPPETA